MYTEEFRLRSILSPRVGRPLSNATLKASPPSSPRAHTERRAQLVSPRLPTLDGRSVRGASLTAHARFPPRFSFFLFALPAPTAKPVSLAAGIRPVNGQTSLSRVSISSAMPYKAEFTEWGDFVQMNNVPGGEMHSTNWSSVADMERAREIRLETDRQQREAALTVFSQESTRQGEEEPKLEKAFFHHTAKLQDGWDEKLVGFDKWVVARKETFQMELDADVNTLQRELDTTLRKKRPKYSPETLQMQHGADTLAKLHRYDEWQDLHKMTEARKAQELVKFNALMTGKCDVRLSHLAEKHKKALKAFDDKWANERYKLIHDRTNDFGQMRQRYKNNLADMRAAHAREFIDLSDRIPHTAVRPRISYMEASSSFRGTHMCRTLQVQLEQDRIAQAGAILN